MLLRKEHSVWDAILHQESCLEAKHIVLNVKCHEENLCVAIGTALGRGSKASTKLCASSS